MNNQELNKETPEEKAKRLGVKVIPKLPPMLPKELNPKGLFPDIGKLNPVVGICGECGDELHRIGNRTCFNQNCPCFPQIIYRKIYEPKQSTKN